MRKFKIIISVALICSLLTAAVAMIAAAAAAPSTAEVIAGNGSYSSSEEVVYALLDSVGAVDNLWVVGTLEVDKAGIVEVYADVSEVKNLTSTSQITFGVSLSPMGLLSDGTVFAMAETGRFYWQGTPRQKELPWDISITYKLDGRDINAAELAGTNGRFELRIETSQNKSFDEVFFKNYMLQITATLDTARFKNIIAPGATASNAGSDKTLAFTVMPGTNGLIELSADVTDFELDSITFAAVPFSMGIDLGDLSGYTGDFTKLADAITELNTGVQELRDGAAILSDGTCRLAGGSAEYRAGLTQISTGGAALKNGSASIISALGELEGADMPGLAQLPAALKQMSAGLKEIGATLNMLSGGYSQALDALGGAISAIPDGSVTEADIYALMAANPGSSTVAALVANYQAAQTVKGTYAAVSEALTGVQTALPALAAGVSEISGSLTAMAAQLEAGFGGDSSGLGGMAAQYTQFHGGLVAYIDGVAALAAGYAQLHSSIAELADGTLEFSGGAQALADGVQELDNETSKLPDKIDDMTSEYTGGDFEPVSFLSDKNNSVELVQFVFRTSAIRLPAKPVAAQPEPSKQTVWTRLLDLFR